MLISLLLDRHGSLIAGGWACDQIPLGNRYWQDVLGIDLPASCPASECETAVVDLSDRDLVDRVLAFHLDPSSQQLSEIMSRLEQPLRTQPRVVVSRFAA